MARGAVRSLKTGISGMASPPENELGVVCLFALMHRRLGFKGIKRIQTRFPDCIAIQRDGSGEKEVRIEFEFRSSDFRRHRHSVRGCDYVVCWKHDWIHLGKSPEVLELRKFLGMGRDAWLQPIAKDRWKWHDQTREKTGRWLGPPSSVKSGDLVLWYCTSPRSYIDQVSLVTSDPAPDRDADRWGHSVKIRVLARLSNPITLHDLRTNPGLSSAPFVKGNFQRTFRATPWWPTMNQLMVAKNPSACGELKMHGPEMF